MDVIRVGIADDQALFAAGIAMVIDAQPDMEVAWRAVDGAQAVEFARSDPHGPIDVVLMDVQMPVLDGIAATAQLLVAQPDTKVVILTTFDDEAYVVGGLGAGASGFLLKDTEPDALLAALRTVLAGDAVISPRATRRIVTRLRDRAAADDGGRAGGTVSLSAEDRGVIDSLTQREGEILVAIARGWTNTEITERLFISMPTVKTHVGRVLAKLGARDRIHAAVFAYRTGLVDREDLLNS